MNTQLNTSHDTVDNVKERLVTDLKRVAADADSLLKDVTASTAERFAETRRKIEAKFAAAKSEVDDARVAAAARAKVAADSAQEYVKEKPWAGIGLAAAAGLVIGLLLRRR